MPLNDADDKEQQGVGGTHWVLLAFFRGVSCATDKNVGGDINNNNSNNKNNNNNNNNDDGGHERMAESENPRKHKAAASADDDDDDEDAGVDDDKSKKNNNKSNNKNKCKNRNNNADENLFVLFDSLPSASMTAKAARVARLLGPLFAPEGARFEVGACLLCVWVCV